MASRKHNIPRANPKTGQESEQDERTEIIAEHGRAKISARIGRRHSMLLWAITYAIIVLSTVAALAVIGSIIKNLGY